MPAWNADALSWGGGSLEYVESDGEWRVLQQETGRVYRFTAISPDRERVAFVHSSGVGILTLEINVITGEFHPGDKPVAGPRTVVSVSPGGSRTALQTDESIVISGPGVSTLKVTLPHLAGCGNIYQPAWSPDGRWLAWSGCPDVVYLIDALSGEWQVVAPRGWCHFRDGGTYYEWKDARTLTITAHPSIC